MSKPKENTTQKISKMFDAYADEDNFVASLDGLSKLGDDIGIDALEDVRILVLMWKMQAKAKPAQINRDEVCKRFLNLKVCFFQVLS